MPFNIALLPHLPTFTHLNLVSPLMPAPTNLKISDYTYQLPDEKIALYPLQQRDASKLLVFKNEEIKDACFSSLTTYLPKDSLLVFNNTRVIPARLLLQKETGGQIEIFVLEATSGEIATAMSQQGGIECLCLVKGAAKWKSGTLKKTLSNENFLEATLIAREAEAFRIQFSWQPAQLSFAEVLYAFGEMPIPPYLHRNAEAEDAERYQTIYARYNGSVAAPTAGLHFTDAVMQSLTEKNIATAYTTLHVGAGTFKPVKSDMIGDHEMHAEWINVEQELVEKLIHYDTVIPVGTTSLRTLESLYWLGLKIIVNPIIPIKELQLLQWEVYETSWPEADAKAALQALLQWMKKNGLQQLVTKTQILIAPGYSFKIIKGLITNFHQPQSTLLLLIAALVGDKWKAIYDHALQNDYRFLSYGDSSFLDNG